MANGKSGEKKSKRIYVNWEQPLLYGSEEGSFFRHPTGVLGPDKGGLLYEDPYHNMHTGIQIEHGCQVGISVAPRR
jgi:hypothetical protein